MKKSYSQSSSLLIDSEIHHPSPPSLLQVVKVESGVSGGPVLTPPQTNELHFLRSRVRELERERAELSAENQRLRNMLVHGESPESPGHGLMRTGRIWFKFMTFTVTTFPRNPWAPVYHVANAGSVQQSPLRLHSNRRQRQLRPVLASAPAGQSGWRLPLTGLHPAAPGGAERGHFGVLGPAGL